MARIEIKIPDWLDRIFAWPVITYRKYKYGLPFRKIPLGEGFFTIVDPDVFYLLNKFNWTARKNHGRIYAVRFFNDIDKESKFLSIHRAIMNPVRGQLVDHKNNITLDNLSSNLRFATASQNAYNKSKTRTKTSSKYCGVSFNKYYRKYEARITFHNKTIWLGVFDSEIEAAKVYDAAAKKYHGEFAHLNFPDETSLHRLPLHIFIKGAKSNDLGKLIGA